MSDSLFKLARMLRTNKVLVALLAAFLSFVTVATASASTAGSLLKTINGTRASRGLVRLRVDSRLTRVARSHSADMLRNNYFSHGSFAARVRASGATGPMFGENLAWGPASAAWVVSQWLASPEHRAILLRPGFRRIGVGTVRGTFAGVSGALVVTADFAGR